MGKRIKDNSGFSLIELLVGLAISCIVLAAAYSFVISGINSYDRTRKTTELQQETQFIENIIVDAVENGHWRSSSINDTTGAFIFDTGNQVLYYDKKDKLALYNKKDDGSLPVPLGDNIDEYLVSKKVADFKVNYINVEPVTDSSGNQIETIGETETETETEADGSVSVKKKKTNLVKVEVKVSMNGKTDSSAKQYKFRNK